MVGQIWASMVIANSYAALLIIDHASIRFQGAGFVVIPLEGIK
jgi:hypothetical protein